MEKLFFFFFFFDIRKGKDFVIINSFGWALNFKGERDTDDDAC